jgi:hypothetical protein
MRKVAIATAAVLAAVVVSLLATRPPAPSSASAVFDAGLMATTIPGAYHVHSTVSDGSASRDRIAAAAARAGLRFVVFTDHGDGTRVPESPRYADGVLCIDAVEISTNGGHYVALDMRPSPYPLGGEAAAVIEDVRRLGGFGIAAHPYSPKPGLDWTDWEAPFDGIEWLNADSEWRDETLPRLLRLPFDYLTRPGPALAATLDRPSEALARWAEVNARRPVVGLAAHDAHGGLSGRDEGGRFWLPGFPSYEASFESFSVRALVASALSGSPAEDARAVLDAIRRGRVFSAIDAVAGPAQLAFTATAGTNEVQMGEALPFEPGIELVVRSTLPDGGTVLLVCDGKTVGESSSGELRSRPDGPMACRPEARAPSAPGQPPVPWIVGNAIHLLSTVIEPVGSEPLFETTLDLREVDWAVEKDHLSQAALTLQGGAVTLGYQLRGGARESQYVAAAARLAPPVPPFDRILFTAAAAAPMRVSVQLRFEGGERWVHSVYVEPDARRAIVPLTALVPAGPRGAHPPDFRNASAILFVVDLVNAVPGSSGSIRISDLAFARALPAR